MPEPAPSTAQKDPGSFARLLASFTGMDEEGNDDWDLSDLPDDVATISYRRPFARTATLAPLHSQPKGCRKLHLP